MDLKKNLDWLIAQGVALGFLGYLMMFSASILLYLFPILTILLNIQSFTLLIHSADHNIAEINLQYRTFTSKKPLWVGLVSLLIQMGLIIFMILEASPRPQIIESIGSLYVMMMGFLFWIALLYNNWELWKNAGIYLQVARKTAFENSINHPPENTPLLHQIKNSKLQSANTFKKGLVLSITLFLSYLIATMLVISNPSTSSSSWSISIILQNSAETSFQTPYLTIAPILCMGVGLGLQYHIIKSMKNIPIAFYQFLKTEPKIIENLSDPSFEIKAFEKMTSYFQENTHEIV